MVILLTITLILKAFKKIHFNLKKKAQMITILVLQPVQARLQSPRLFQMTRVRKTFIHIEPVEEL